MRVRQIVTRCDAMRCDMSGTWCGEEDTQYVIRGKKVPTRFKDMGMQGLVRLIRNSSDAIENHKVNFRCGVLQPDLDGSSLPHQDSALPSDVCLASVISIRKA